MTETINVGDAAITPEVQNGDLRSLGDIRVHDIPLRNTRVRFLPWFDSYAGEVFRRFQLQSIERDGDDVTIRTTAVSDPDTVFQERRDSSGDVCLKQRHWDAEPIRAEFDIHLRPARQHIDGRAFSGFTYWFAYRSQDAAIHRILDRQTWELGGDTEDVTLLCRNLFDVPSKDLSNGGAFSTVGLDQSVGVLPGNLWARWSLMPAFDMQYGPAGVFVSWFDRVSLIRSVVESLAEEQWARYLDLHYFEQGHEVRTNPKTVLYCADELDDVDAINLWTRVHDQERDKARRQFDMPTEEAPRLAYGCELWRNYSFEDDYGPGVEIAREFELDQIFIGPVWESGETFNQTLRGMLSDEAIDNTVLGKLAYNNKCTGLDIEVGESHGGVEGLKNLCDRAAAANIDVLAWMACHMSSRTSLASDPAFGAGYKPMFAMKESGRHPDSGYTAECWPLDLNNPAVYRKFRDGFMRIARDTGLKGFLWDSFSNLGWWQIDYRHGTMRPQFDKVCQIYSDFVNAGHYLNVEAIVSFSSHSCVGLHGGNVYAGHRLPFSYDTNFSLNYLDEDQRQGETTDQIKRMLFGEKAVDELFRCLAHRRGPRFARRTLTEDRERWDEQAVEAVKDTIRIYKAVRDRMQRRTVLKQDRGVLWEDGSDHAVLFAFHDMTWADEATDAGTAQPVTDGMLRKNRAYFIPAEKVGHMNQANGQPAHAGSRAGDV